MHWSLALIFREFESLANGDLYFLGGRYFGNGLSAIHFIIIDVVYNRHEYTIMNTLRHQ